MKWVVVLLWLAFPAGAQTVQISSGDHDSYARLVLNIAEGSTWQLGRTPAGYELALSGDDLRFDLSRVFDLIPKTRLSGIFADPVTGRLQLAVSCVCHALPFQLDARTLVIDLRDGPAPPASSFELTLEGGTLPPLTAAQPPRPRPRPATAAAELRPDANDGGTGPAYDWLTVRQSGAPRDLAAAAESEGPATGTSANLQPLRDTLIRQLSRGATDGVVELVLPKAQPTEQLALQDAQTRVTRMPGMAVQTERTATAQLQPDGAACVPDAALDLAAWGQPEDTPAQIAMARAALVGEFDKPDQAAVAQSVRHHLYLGFGAEAEMTIAAFNATDSDVPVWISLAQIMDGRSPEPDAFADMAGCDTAAALWAVLAATATTDLGQVNVPAVQRAFSALPAHLRLHLAPSLADRATSMGEAELARAVTAATNRNMVIPAGSQVILQARTDLAEGRPSDAATAMAQLLAEGGPQTAEAVILLTAARVALTEPLSPDVPGVAAALMPEYEGTDLEPALRQAWQLGLAAAGDFAGAMAANPDAATMRDIWRLMARLGTDDTILAHGILAQGAKVDADADVARTMAERLLALGFAEPAARWANVLRTEAEGDDRLLLARIDLARGDGRAVLTILAGQTTADALMLKAQAEEALGQPGLARVTWGAAGDAAASTRAAGWAQSWVDVAQTGEGEWQNAAAVVVSPRAPAGGILANGQALVADSAAVRAQVAALLAAVPQP